MHTSQTRFRAPIQHLEQFPIVIFTNAPRRYNRKSGMDFKDDSTRLEMFTQKKLKYISFKLAKRICGITSVKINEQNLLVRGIEVIQDGAQ